MLYPADPPSVEEIVSVMRHAGEDPHGFRLLAMIVMLWRGGLRVQEALALSERDLDPRRGSVLVHHGKGGRRREVGMDAWGWENLGLSAIGLRALLAPPPRGGLRRLGQMHARANALQLLHDETPARRGLQRHLEPPAGVDRNGDAVALWDEDSESGSHGAFTATHHAEL